MSSPQSFHAERWNVTLSSVEVEACLDRHPPCVSPQTTLREASARLDNLEEARGGYLCVTEGNRWLGVVTATIVLAALVRGGDLDRSTVGEVAHALETDLILEDLERFDRAIDLAERHAILPVVTREADSSPPQLVGVLNGRQLLARINRQLRERDLLALKVQSSELQLRQLLEAIASAVLVVDADGNTIQVIPTQAVLDESSSPKDKAETLVDRTVAQFLHPDRGAQFLEPVRLALQTQNVQTFEYEVSIGDRQVWYSAEVSPIAESDSALWVAREIVPYKPIEPGLADLSGAIERRVAARTIALQEDNDNLQRELSKRQQVEEALQRSEKRFEIALKHSPISVFTKNLQQRYTWAYNPPDGLDNEVFIGRSNAEIFSLEDARYLNNLERRVLSSGTGTREAAFVTIDERLHYYDLTVDPLHDRQGNTVGIVYAWMDITDRKLAEEALKTLNYELESIVEERTAQLQATNTQLLQALAAARELNDLKSRFVTMTSHEFRTPLTTILGSVELLKHYSHKWNEAKKQVYLDRIRTTVGHMTCLLDDILTLNKAETGQLVLSPVELNLLELCQGIVKGCADSNDRSHPILLTHRGLGDESSPRNVKLDAWLLRQILTHLLSNAMKYSEPGTPIDFNLVLESEYVSFAIQDRGKGIPLADRKHLFASFHRANNVGNVQGTGLGLSIVKKAVDLHRGTIQIDSTEEVGTTVTVTIPLTQEE
ncbi:MAG: PAS domain-containing protein [Cyanobacteria bacterium SID2]|nr:PAS domain-containing protein [Cyanobacteria bacterium SID2]MBP0005987.1 PAS domain-containing protein [Cyanobacteria bacterium SBC]